MLTVSLFHPTQLALAVFGAQDLRASGLGDIAFSADALSASIRLWGGAPALARIDAAGVSGGVAGSRRPGDVRVAALQVRITAAGDPQVDQAWEIRRPVGGGSEGTARILPAFEDVGALGRAWPRDAPAIRDPRKGRGTSPEREEQKRLHGG